MGNIEVFKKKTLKSSIGRSIEVNNVKNPEFVNNVIELRPGCYYKYVCQQDITRTPSVSVNAVQDFFNFNLEDGASVLIDLIFENTNYSVELNKRRTRNEYRFFINRIKDDIVYDVDDILSFYKKNGKIHLNILKKNQHKYDEIFDKMQNKLHLLE